MLLPAPAAVRRPLPLALAAALSLLPFAPPSALALSLVPRTETFERDGVPLSRIVFDDGPQTVRLRLPAGWTVSGTETSAVVHPANPQSEAAITRVDGKPAGFDKPGQDAYARTLLTSVPPDSTAVTEVSRADNPLGFSDAPSFEFVCSYTYFGRTFRRALVVMNHPRYQLRFTLNAPAEAFDALHKDWNGSLFGLEWEDKPKAGR